jgi:hypothetical protein
MYRPVVLALLVSGRLACVSVGTLDLVTRPSGDPGRSLREQQPYTEVGQVTGQSCRVHVLGIFSAGDADLESAMEKVLLDTEADAIINVTVSTSHYDIVPIYNLVASTWSTVKGTAVHYGSS